MTAVTGLPLFPHLNQSTEFIAPPWIHRWWEVLYSSWYLTWKGCLDVFSRKAWQTLVPVYWVLVGRLPGYISSLFNCPHNIYPTCSSNYLIAEVPRANRTQLLCSCGAVHNGKILQHTLKFDEISIFGQFGWYFKILLFLNVTVLRALFLCCVVYVAPVSVWVNGVCAVWWTDTQTHPELVMSRSRSSRGPKY